MGARWIVCLIFTLGLAVVFAVLFRKRRPPLSPFLCPKCGYDLRSHAGPGAVTCPECGATYD